MKTFNVIDWMTSHGHPGYAREIQILEDKRAKAYPGGPLWQDLKIAIDEVRQAAQDRYDDWVSDLDYC